MYKFTFEALAPLIEELESYIKICKEDTWYDFINDRAVNSFSIEELLEIIKPYKALVEERKNQIESLQDGSRAWANG